MNYWLQIADFRYFLVSAGVMLMLSASAPADGLQAEATLSEATASVGEPVELQVKITGASSANIPNTINVDGLSITFAGQVFQQSLQFGTGSKNMHTASLIAKYTVIPQRAGTFTIPQISLESGGKKAATNALTLTVKAGGGLQKNESQGESIFAELVPARSESFVGETVPLELRVYVDSRIHWEANEPPTIKGDGFTLQKFAASPSTTVVKNGRSYNMVAFRTAVTPAKTGRFSIGPGEFNVLAQLPRQKSRRPHFGGGSLFDDDFFNDPFGMFAAPQKIAVRANPVNLEVKSLPSGAPKSFTGAVGRFTFLADASPRNVRIGDPITLTLKISGRGNFDRITAPRFSDESGWRSYPSSAKFTADDEIGISGTKTFEMAVIPEVKKSAAPVVEFSYFDPVAEKYVALRSERMPITVEGEKIAATPAPREQEAPKPPLEKAAGTATDILYLRTDTTRWGESFAPLYRTRGFWIVQIVPLLAFIGFAGIQLRRMRARNEKAAWIANLRRKKTAMLKILQREGGDNAAFLDGAVKCLQIETALATGKNFATIDAEDVCAARAVDSEAEAGIRSIFSECAELRYAGAVRDGDFHGINRAEILNTIRRFERSQPRA